MAKIDVVVTIILIAVVIGAAVLFYVFISAKVESSNIRVQQATQDCMDACSATYDENLSYIEAKGVCGTMTYDAYKCCEECGNWTICKASQP